MPLPNQTEVLDAQYSFAGELAIVTPAKPTVTAESFAGEGILFAPAVSTTAPFPQIVIIS